VKDRHFVMLQKALPKQLITELMGWFAERHIPIITPVFIKWFAGKYQTNMEEAVSSDLKSYRTFNEFFTRPLREGVRPNQAKPDQLSCPVDGAISQMTHIDEQSIIQAKGKHYSVQALVANEEVASHFTNGLFTTIYLSPKDYHRIHMPIKGELKSMTYVPGKLYSVNPATVNELDDLFAINERVVCEFDTAQGKMLMILVGATIVGSIETIWSGTITPPRAPKVHTWNYSKGDVILDQGDEMGRFKLGSTVIMLFENEAFEWLPELNAADPVQLGQLLAIPHTPAAVTEDAIS
jgi:phosphatidylserine decarboxylase